MGRAEKGLNSVSPVGGEQAGMRCKVWGVGVGSGCWRTQSPPPSCLQAVRLGGQPAHLPGGREGLACCCM